MKKDRLKKIVPLSLSTILTLMPTANAFAAPGDVLNDGNNKQYDISSLNWSSLQALIKDIKDGNSENPSGAEDTFLREHKNGKYYNYDLLLEARKNAIEEELKNRNINVNDLTAVAEYVKDPKNLKEILEVAMAAEEKFIKKSGDVIEDIDTYEKINYVGDVHFKSNGVFDNYYGYKKIKGNVTIEGDSIYEITLDGLTIDGDLIINAPNADVTLRNITILGKTNTIEIQNVRYGTANFDGVKADNIKATDPDGCILNSVGGGITGRDGGQTQLEISPESPSQFALSGNFQNSNLRLTKPSSLRAELGARINNVDIEIEDEEDTEGVVLEGDLSTATVTATGQNRAPVQLAQDTIVGTVNKEEGAQGQMTAEEGVIVESLSENLEKSGEIEKSSEAEVKRAKINRAEAAVTRAEDKLEELKKLDNNAAEMKQWHKLQKDVDAANRLIDKFSDGDVKTGFKQRIKVVQDAVVANYDNFKAAVEGKVATYETNVQAALKEAKKVPVNENELNKKINTAKKSRKEISLKGLKNKDKKIFRDRVSEADRELEVVRKQIDYNKAKELAKEAVVEYEKAIGDAKQAADNYANKENSTEEELEVQKKIHEAIAKKPNLDLDIFSDSFREYLEVRIMAADTLLAKAQKILDDKKEYDKLKAEIEAKVKAYEDAAAQDLSTQDSVDEAKKLRNEIIMPNKLNSNDKAEFNKRLAVVDAKVAEAQKVIDYAKLKKAAEEKVAQYEIAAAKLNFAELSTMELINAAQKLVDEAVNVKDEISLEGLELEHENEFNTRIEAADELVNKAEKAIYDAIEAFNYKELRDAVEQKVEDYENLVENLFVDINLLTEKEIDKAKIAKFNIRYDGLKGNDRKYFVNLVEKASAKVNDAQNVLDAKKAIEELQKVIENDLTVKENLENAENSVKQAEKAFQKIQNIDIPKAIKEQLKDSLDSLKEKVTQARQEFKYKELKDSVQAKIREYEQKVEDAEKAETLTQELIYAASAVRAEISLAELNEADTTEFTNKVSSLDGRLAALQAKLDAQKDYNDLKADIEAKVKAYEELAQRIKNNSEKGTLTQKLIDEAKRARANIVLSDILKEADKAAFQKRIDDAEKIVLEAEKKLHDELHYDEVKKELEKNLAAYERLANRPLTSRKLIDKAKAAGAKVELSVLKDEDEDKAKFQERKNAADQKVQEAETYISLVEKIDQEIYKYENLVLGDLSTQELRDKARAERIKISLEGLEQKDKVKFQRRLDEADKVLADASDIKRVYGYEPISDAYGTPFEKLNLPSTVKVKLASDELKDLAVEWKIGSYKGNKPGNYILEGNIKLEGDVSNSQKLKASIIVEVKEVAVTIEKFEPYVYGVFKGKVEVGNPENITIELWSGIPDKKLGSTKLNSDGSFRISNFENVDILGNYSYRVLNENGDILAQGKVILSSKVIKVEALEDVYVMQGASFEKLPLPKNVKVETDQGTREVDVEWLNGNYDANKPSEYIIQGKLKLKDGMVNEDNIKASMKIVVNKVQLTEKKFYPGIGIFTSILTVENAELLKGDTLNTLTVELWGDTLKNKIGTGRVDNQGRVGISLVATDPMGNYSYKVINKDGNVILIGKPQK